jgi:hypothetical protein
MCDWLTLFFFFFVSSHIGFNFVVLAVQFCFLLFARYWLMEFVVSLITELGSWVLVC